jgi:hypothetical protein
MRRWASQPAAAERASAPPRAEPPPAALLRALQRGAGNHALARALTRPAEPLPDGVRRPLEAAFGSSFADVRVDRASSGAAALGAEAVTRGSEIHFAPGRYDPAGAAGRELIGHELAHVVQQRQGRVAPGLDLDRSLEREADAHARLAAHGEPTGTPRTAPLAGEPAAAQAKFGFEFQSLDNAFIAHGGVPIVGEKELAFENTAKKFKVEGDEGADADHFDVEFITEALTTVEEARTAVEGAAALAENLAASEPIATRTENQAFDGGKWTRAVKIQIRDATFTAKPQASVGVTLADFPELVEASFGTETREQLEGITERVAEDPQWKGASHGADPSPALSGFLQVVALYLVLGHMTNPKDPLEPESFPDLDDQVLPGDGPKTRFAFMARTDFHSMFKSLPAEDQEQFTKGLVGAADSPVWSRGIETALGVQFTDPVINGPYRADREVEDLLDAGKYKIEPHADRQGKMHPIVMEGPTVLDWLLSIVTGMKYKDGEAYAAKGRDMLSAPVGWGSRASDKKGFPTTTEIKTGHVYGMGAYPMDKPAEGDSLAIFELRAISDQLESENLAFPEAADWWKAAQAAIAKQLKPGMPKVTA